MLFKSFLELWHLGNGDNIQRDGVGGENFIREVIWV